ncbi:putative transcriptional regulator [Thermoplasmatales archaeon SCGC AB-540-F20]|nr:putative transcriptional regulator [Thermoplasmatales archaeon SCGC AB-540-F20]
MEKKINKKFNSKAGENKIVIKDIKIINDLYPRSEFNEKKIQEYAENLDILPPIKINPNNILVDGLHRIKAHEIRGKKEIEYIIENIPDEQVLLKAIELNAKFGIQLSMKDKKRLAIKLFDGKNGKKLQQMLSVAKSTFNNWIKHIREEKKILLEQEIIQEYLNAESSIKSIAKKFDTPSSTVGDIVNKYPKLLNLVFSDKPWTAEMHNTFDHLGEFEPFIGNVWNIDDTNMEEDWDLIVYREFTEIPIGVYENLLFYFTEPFDVVLTSDNNFQIIKKWYRRYTSNSNKSINFIIAQYNEELKINELVVNLKKDGHVAVIHSNRAEFKTTDDLELVEKISIGMFKCYL